jgi:hypothetical protein
LNKLSYIQCDDFEREPNPNRTEKNATQPQAQRINVSVHGVIDFIEIPNNKSQKNKQITMTEIQNPKQKNNRFASGP